MSFGPGNFFNYILCFFFFVNTHPPSGNNNNTTPTMVPPSATSPILCHLSMSTCGTPNEHKRCVYTLFGPGNFSFCHYSPSPPPSHFVRREFYFILNCAPQMGPNDVLMRRPSLCTRKTSFTLFLTVERHYGKSTRGTRTLWHKYSIWHIVKLNHN